MDWITSLNSLAWESSARRLWGLLSEVLWIEKINVYRSEDLGEAFADALHSQVEVVWSFADESIVDSLVRDKELHITSADGRYYVELLREGNKLVVGKVGESNVFYGTIAINRKRMYSKYFALRNNELFIMRCFTRAEYRGLGIYPSAIQHMCAALKKEGYCDAYIDIATHNRISIRGAEKAGMVRTDTSYYRVRIFGKDLIMPRGSLGTRFV